MAEIVKESVTTQVEGPKEAVTTETKSVATSSQRAEYVIYFIFGLLEILLAFRLVLKIMGASAASGFVRFIYSLTGVFILPFEGIFRRGMTQGIETTSVLEPSSIVALIVYAVLAWGIVKLTRIFSGEKQTV
ncbi:MAG: hypothetical protein WC799_24705 [Desulfobacteraceae bacterium]|jgi:hypothetical protein